MKAFKKALQFVLILNVSNSLAALNTVEVKTWSFSYKIAKTQTLKINKNAPSYEEAFKLAAKDCYQKMTQGKYPGEEKGLEIIDICANPKS